MAVVVDGEIVETLFLRHQSLGRDGHETTIQLPQRVFMAFSASSKDSSLLVSSTRRKISSQLFRIKNITSGYAVTASGSVRCGRLFLDFFIFSDHLDILDRQVDYGVRMLCVANMQSIKFDAV